MTSPSDKVTYGTTVYGHTAYIDRRTAAHLDYTKNALAGQHPGCTLLLIQAGYNTTVAASAGTHDKGAVVDVKIEGLSWDAAERFLRSNGWAAWHRHPPEFSTEHIHMVSLGYTCAVGIYVPGQVEDYLQHRTGLVGHAHDPSWFPPNINATVFDYESWENDMPLSDEDIAKIAKAVWAQKMPSFGNLAVGSIVRRIATALKVSTK